MLWDLLFANYSNFLIIVYLNKLLSMNDGSRMVQYRLTQKSDPTQSVIENKLEAEGNASNVLL